MCEQTSLTPPGNVTPEKDTDTLLNKNDGTPSGKSVLQTTNEQQENFKNDSPMLGIPITEALGNDANKNDSGLVEVPVTVTDREDVASTPNGELLNESTPEVREENSSPLLAKQFEISSKHHPVEDDSATKSGSFDVPQKTDQEKPQSENTEAPNNSETQSKAADVKVEPLNNQKKQQEQKADSAPKKVQEQLDEVKHLTLGGDLSYSN